MLTAIANPTTNASPILRKASSPEVHRPIPGYIGALPGPYQGAWAADPVKTAGSYRNRTSAACLPCGVQSLGARVMSRRSPTATKTCGTVKVPRAGFDIHRQFPLLPRPDMQPTRSGSPSPGFLKALLCAGAESCPAAPAMDLRLWAPLLVRVPRNDRRADRFNDFADPLDSCLTTAILPKSRPSSAKSSASS